jgi:Gpi18-like mannosyltransferase
VLFNSAAWGQCDGIYTCFIIMSLFYLLRERDILSMAMFGMAFAVKLQAVFFAPFVLVMLLQVRSEEKRLRHDFGNEYEQYCRRTGRFFPKI